jgi:hypothetical protein
LELYHDQDIWSDRQLQLRLENKYNLARTANL